MDDEKGVTTLWLVFFVVMGGFAWHGHNVDKQKVARLDRIEANAANALNKTEALESDLDDVKSTLSNHNID